MSLPVLVFALALSAAAGMIFGLIPAWQLSFVEPQNALRGDSRTQAGQTSHSRMRSGLIVGEFALAVILLSATGLLVRSFIFLQQENLGFTPTNLLVATVHLPVGEPARTRSTNAFFESALKEVKSAPGVVDVAVTADLFSNYTPNTDVLTEEAEHSSHSVQTAPSTVGIVSEQFFRTMKIPLLRGRSFSEYDGSGRPPVAVINKTMADQFWPRQNPIGRHFHYGSPGEIRGDWLTVIGVAGDMNPYGPGSQVIATFYRPYRQATWPASMDLVIRYDRGRPRQWIDSLRRAIRSVNRSIPRFTVQTVTGVLAQMSAPRRFEMWLLSVFSGIALCLATVGIYGVLNYLVSKRTREIGLRMALGASPQDVLRLVVASGVKLAALGIISGLGAAFFLARLVRHLLFEVSPSDPLVMVVVSMTLLTAACAASYFPARRATRLDPLTSIRHD